MKIIRVKNSDKSLLDSMKSLAESDKPQVGIFWFDKNEFELFGVHKSDADSVTPDSSGRRIYPKLHYQLWNKDKFRAKAKGENYLRFNGNYVDTPRGRVNKEGDEFILYVGDWIDEPYAQKDTLIELIKAEFNLDNLTVVIDPHWNIGHGFSGDKFMN